jgi:hypothetical protein
MYFKHDTRTLVSLAKSGDKYHCYMQGEAGIDLAVASISICHVQSSCYNLSKPVSIALTHFIIGQKNWEEVANYVAGWLRDKNI